MNAIAHLHHLTAYWWLASAGPFTEEEQREWEQSFSHHLDEATKTRLGTLMARSAQREVRAAMDEQREPLLHYPALDIEDVHTRIAALLQLDTEVLRDEPNALVCSLYHDTIEEELHFLYLIQATHERNNEHFQEHNSAFYTHCQHQKKCAMSFLVSALSSYNAYLTQEQRKPVNTSSRYVSSVASTFDLSYTEEEEAGLHKVISFAPSQSQAQMVSAQAAKRFFEAVFQKTDCTGWKIVTDS